MKCCKDCKWARYAWFDIDSALCRRPTGEVDSVTGELIHYYEYCEIERLPAPDEDACCGPDARYFEERIPWYKRLWRWLTSYNDQLERLGNLKLHKEVYKNEKENYRKQRDAAKGKDEESNQD